MQLFEKQSTVIEKYNIQSLILHISRITGLYKVYMYIQCICASSLSINLYIFEVCVEIILSIRKLIFFLI